MCKMMIIREILQLVTEEEHNEWLKSHPIIEEEFTSELKKYS